MGVTGYEVSLFIHITAAIAGLGITFAEGLIYPVSMRLDPRHLPLKHRLQLTINSLVALPALLVLTATGLYQANEAGFELGVFWLIGALTIVIILALLIGAYFIPEDRRLQQMIEGEIEAAGGGEITLSPEYRRRVHIETAVGSIADVLIIAAVYLMVTKPGL